MKRRYIDDEFAIARNEDHAKNFIADLQKQLRDTAKLKISFEISQEKAVYLDVTVYKGPNWSTRKMLDVALFSKPTNKFLYLHCSSNHQRSVMKGIVKGELMRAMRNTREQYQWQKNSKELLTPFSQRGYFGKVLREVSKQMVFKNRK